MANLSDKIGPSGVLTGVTGESIKNLSDVYSSMSPTDGQALIYDTTNGWQSETLESGGAAPVDTQTFTTSGTWTKPASGSFAIIEVWGGGGSGTKSSVGCGGGGGGYNVLQIDLSSLGSTETVTIGAGGASQTTANTSGNNGGNTTFGSHLTGYGGGGGTYSSALGGGGGGMRGAPHSTYSYNPGAGYSEPTTTTTNDTFGNTHVHITAGATGLYITSGNASGRFSYYGGGSGGTGTNASYGASGGGSYYGGAGGGSHGATPGSGGVSRFGGNGGDGDGSAGSQPGGGGGGSNFAVDSGAGGDGMCVVKVYA